MQSVLQYRKLRKQIQEQIESHELNLESYRADRDVRQAKDDKSKKDISANSANGQKSATNGSNPSSSTDESVSTTSSTPRGESKGPPDQTRSEEPRDDDLEMGTVNGGRHHMSEDERALRSATLGKELVDSLNCIDVQRHATSPEQPKSEVFVVGFTGAYDEMNPLNWPTWTKFHCTLVVGSVGSLVGMASAIDSAALQEASRDFGVSEVVESMATGLFLVGFGIGSLFAGPVSETVGRNPVYIASLLLYMVFVMASALAPNIGAQLAFRFLAGLFGESPLTCAGGSIADLWGPIDRIWAFPVFATFSFAGPMIGPVIGGWIVQSSVLSWRWTDWITLIMSAVVLAVVVLTQPETYAPILLGWKANHLRQLTGEQKYKAEIEIRGEHFAIRLRRALWRPFVLSAQEPIVICFTIYLTIVYIVQFTFLDGYDFIFGDVYNISKGLVGTCFTGIIIGLFCAFALAPLLYRWAVAKTSRMHDSHDSLPPEFRLWHSMLGGALAIPISLFWMAWTAQPSISIWSPLVASVLFGYGILCVFISSYQYIIDSYTKYAASALTGMTFVRYVAAGGMTVVGIPWYRNEGPAYTLTIMACLSAVLVPIPYILYFWGSAIRRKSKYSGSS